MAGKVHIEDWMGNGDAMLETGSGIVTKREPDVGNLVKVTIKDDREDVRKPVVAKLDKTKFGAIPAQGAHVDYQIICRRRKDVDPGIPYAELDHTAQAFRDLVATKDHEDLDAPWDGEPVRPMHAVPSHAQQPRGAHNGAGGAQDTKEARMAAQNGGERAQDLRASNYGKNGVRHLAQHSLTLLLDARQGHEGDDHYDYRLWAEDRTYRARKYLASLLLQAADEVQGVCFEGTQDRADFTHNLARYAVLLATSFHVAPVHATTGAPYGEWYKAVVDAAVQELQTNEAIANELWAPPPSAQNAS